MKAIKLSLKQQVADYKFMLEDMRNDLQYALKRNTDLRNQLLHTDKARIKAEESQWVYFVGGVILGATLITVISAFLL